MLFKIATLLSVELIALICASFMFIYVKAKKETLDKFYTYWALSFIGIVILMITFTLAATICFAACRPHHEDGEKRRMYMNKEMRFYERDCDGDECERGEENCKRGSMDCCKEEECEGKMDTNCCKSEKDKESCKKDTTIEHKATKK